MTIRVLLADDERAFRDTLARLLLLSGHADVVATASNGREAVELYRELMPEAVLMDVVMPVCDGIEATRRILAVDADARIITLTSGDDYRALTLCLAAGARGCLKKGPEYQHARRADARDRREARGRTTGVWLGGAHARPAVMLVLSRPSTIGTSTGAPAISELKEALVARVEMIAVTARSAGSARPSTSRPAASGSRRRRFGRSSTAGRVGP